MSRIILPVNKSLTKEEQGVEKDQIKPYWPRHFVAFGKQLVAAACTAVAASASPALAQSPRQPATEELIRQQERERQLRREHEIVPSARLPVPQASQGLERISEDEAACVLIHVIELSGESADRFQWAADRAHFTAAGDADTATGRCLGTRGVNLVMRRIQNAIVGRGFVAARVLAGPQDKLADGTLELTLFPGRIRHIRLAPGTDARATLRNAMPMQPGDLLNLRDIEQALENLQRLPTVQADIQVAAAEGLGAQPGEADLVILWKQSLPLRVSMAADDSGSRATGKYQGNVTLSWDHWWTLNDLFYLSLNHNLSASGSGEKGTRGYTAHYSLPLGRWMLGLTASASRYRQSVPGASQTYLYSGESHNSEVKLSRLVWRDALRRTTLSVRAWTRDSRNFIDDTELQVQRRRTGGVDLGISHREYQGDATLDLNVNYRRGTGAFGSMAAPEEAFGEGTSRPGIIMADAQLQVPFSLGGERLRYSGSWRAQWNRTPLVPQDRFSIGSRYTVRGFDGESQLLAERGWLVRNDLGWALGSSGQELYLGIDHGEVGGPGSAALIGTRMSGAVLGLRGGAKGFSWDVFAGAPLSRPTGFSTAGSVAGFHVNWSY